MSLYDDIPQPKELPREPNVRAASSIKHASSFAPIVAPVAPPRIVQSSNAQVTNAKSSTGKRPDLSFTRPPDAAFGNCCPSKSAQAPPDFIAVQRAAILKALPTSNDEYEPAVPNEYATIRQALEMYDSRQAIVEPSRNVSGQGLNDDNGERSVNGISFDGLKSISSEDESEGEERTPNAPFVIPIVTEPTMDPKVSRMMAKMGWTVGTGLGKSKQGRTDPIRTVGYDGREGLGKASPVIHFSETSDTKINKKTPGRVRHQVSRSRRPTSRVLLVQLTGRIEQNLLDGKIRSICAAHGDLKHIIVKIDDDCSAIIEDGESAKHEDAVRAYVMFERSESATAALLALDGAQMLGDKLRTSLYPERLFYRMKSHGNCSDDNEYDSGLNVESAY